MNYSEEYYKMKYFKYKSKYFELKHNLEGGVDVAGNVVGNVLGTVIVEGIGKGIAKGTQGTSRIIKKIGKSVLGSLGLTNIRDPKEERLKIYRIVQQYNLIKNVTKDKDGRYEVKSFLDNLKKKIAETKDDTIRTDLNYVLGKHYMCKSLTFQVYDQKDCFEEIKK
jgi:hypothetical protein